MVDFQGTKLDLAGINKYLETADVELSETEKQTLNSIFTDSDTFNDKTKAKGKDGKLNNEEWDAFVAQIKNQLPQLLKSILNFKTEETLNAHLKAETEKIAPRDKTYVAPIAVEYTQNTKHKTQNTKELQVPQKISKNSDIRTNYDWSEEEFNKVLNEMLDNPRYNGKFKNSVLRNQGKAFIEAGKKYNIDPRVLVSIAMVESGRGTSKKAINLNNVGGLIINGQYHHFNDVSESIDSIAKTIDTRYKEGYTTLNKIGNSGRYCAKQASQSWISQGSSYFNFFDKFYKTK